MSTCKSDIANIHITCQIEYGYIHITCEGVKLPDSSAFLNGWKGIGFEMDLLGPNEKKGGRGLIRSQFIPDTDPGVGDGIVSEKLQQRIFCRGLLHHGDGIGFYLEVSWSFP